jgi:hypothetical protein
MSLKSTVGNSLSELSDEKKDLLFGREIWRRGWFKNIDSKDDQITSNPIHLH